MRRAVAVADEKIADMSSSNLSGNRPGRPRASTEGGPSQRSGREQILDAAAALFVEFGFSATSTRAIADRVGIRQQSLYYHFAGKDEILVELLNDSVRPSNDFVAGIEAGVVDAATAAAALYALASVDAATLRRSPHNIGTLYLHPEVQDARFDGFRAERIRLGAAYARLGRAAARAEAVETIDEPRLGMLLIHIAEVIIQLRREGGADEHDDGLVAATCLRTVGLDTSEIARARADAAELMEAAEHVSVS